MNIAFTEARLTKNNIKKLIGGGREGYPESYKHLRG